MLKKQAVSETSRFNWKDGFYNPEKIEIYKAMNEKALAEKEAANQLGRGRPSSNKRAKSSYRENSRRSYSNKKKRHR